MKECTKCGEMKFSDEFHRNRSAKDGLCADCKECRKATNRDYRERNEKLVHERGRKHYAEHKQEYINRELRKDPAQKRAQARLYQAVKRGEIARPGRCEHCGKECKPDGHHWHGYDLWWDVIWLCRRCHFRVHSGVINAEELQPRGASQGTGCEGPPGNRVQGQPHPIRATGEDAPRGGGELRPVCPVPAN